VGRAIARLDLPAALEQDDRLAGSHEVNRGPEPRGASADDDRSRAADERAHGRRRVEDGQGLGRHLFAEKPDADGVNAARRALAGVQRDALGA
jgi:hypothetical protein